MTNKIDTAKITTRITQLNAVQNIGYHTISLKEKATAEQVDLLEKSFEVALPSDLRHFYLEIGGLQSYDMEQLCLYIEEPSSLLEKLQKEDKWCRCNSLGLIDYMKLRWGNDRYELEAGSYLEKESIQFLNDHYKCLGFYEVSGWCLEENYYLYFDPNGKFGAVRYHQDYPCQLMEEYLLPLLKDSLAKETLEEILLRIIDQLTHSILHKEEL